MSIGLRLICVAGGLEDTRLAFFLAWGSLETGVSRLVISRRDDLRNDRGGPEA